MFTGLIEAIGTIETVERRNGNITLSISSPFSAELKPDQSVAVDGVCLTVTSCDARQFRVDAIDETLHRTTLAKCTANTKVHLERAMRADGRLDGHIVQGHIDHVVSIIRVEARAGSKLFWFRLPVEVEHYVVEKGSVALSGVSLTVAMRRGMEAAVAIIPHTMDKTLAHTWRVGTVLNLETDIFAKYVESVLKK